MASSEVVNFKSHGERENLRFLLIGNTGTGKSCTGNTILGYEKFKSEVSFGSVSSECSIGRTKRSDGTMIEVIDSPGLFDTNLKPEKIGALIVQTIAMMFPGPDAILYVMSLSSLYTDEHYAGYVRIKALLDENVTKYTIIVFTHGDLLTEKKTTIKELLDKCEDTNKIKLVLNECSERYVVFDNKTSEKEPQIEDLLKKVRRLKSTNDGKVYECPKFVYVQTIMGEEIATRMEAVEQAELDRSKYGMKLKDKVKKAEEETKKAKEEIKNQTELFQRNLKINDEKREKEIETLKTKLENEKAEIERQKKIEEKRFQETEIELQNQRKQLQKAEEERGEKEIRDLKCSLEREKTDKEKEKQLINDLRQQHEKQREDERRRWKEEDARRAEYNKEAKAREERAEKQFKDQMQELEKKQKAEQEKEKENATFTNDIKKLEDDYAAKLKELNDTILKIKEDEARKEELYEKELKMLKDLILKLSITNKNDLNMLKFIRENNISLEKLKDKFGSSCLIL